MGLMHSLRTRTHQQCEVRLGLPGGTFSHLYNQTRKGFTVALLDRIQGRSGVSFEQLMAWYRVPDDEPLGRINEQAGAQP
jgi:hypothetical protein